MKIVKILLAVVLVLLAALIILWVTLPKAILMGDINNNGAVDETDLDLIHKHISKTIELTEDEKTRADMNQDGEINLLDLFDIHMIIRGEQNGKYR